MPIDTLASAGQTDRIFSLMTPANTPSIRRGTTGYASFDTLGSAATSPKRRSHPLRMAGKVVKIAVVTLAISGTLFVIGAAATRLSTLLRVSTLPNAGKQAQLTARIASALAQAALWCKRGSQTLFLAVTVPPYILLYQFPRWLLIEKLPIALTLSHRWAQTVHLIIWRIARNINVRLADATHRVRQLFMPYILHSRQWIHALSKQWHLYKEGVQKAWQWSQLKAIDLARSALNALKGVVFVAKERVLQLIVRYRHICQKISQTTQAVTQNLLTAALWIYHAFQPLFDTLLTYSAQLGTLIKEASASSQRQLIHLFKTGTELFIKTLGHTATVLWTALDRLKNGTDHLLTQLIPTLRALVDRLMKAKTFFIHASQRTLEIAAQTFQAMVKNGRLIMRHLADWNRWLRDHIGPVLMKMTRALKSWLNQLAPHVAKIVKELSQAANFAKIYLVKASIQMALGTMRAFILAKKQARLISQALKPYLKQAGSLIGAGAKHFRRILADGLGTFWVFLRRMRDHLYRS